jgi:hypothetical protein
MGTFIAWLMLKTGWSEKAARAAAHVALILLVLAILGGVVAFIRKDAVDDHQAKVERRAAPATDKAATERARDTIATTRHEQELHDVIAAEPDQPIAPTSRALACKRLHDAGRDPPACR